MGASEREESRSGGGEGVECREYYVECAEVCVDRVTGEVGGIVDV